MAIMLIGLFDEGIKFENESDRLNVLNVFSAIHEQGLEANRQAMMEVPGYDPDNSTHANLMLVATTIALYGQKKSGRRPVWTAEMRRSLFREVVSLQFKTNQTESMCCDFISKMGVYGGVTGATLRRQLQLAKTEYKTRSGQK